MDKTFRLQIAATDLDVTILSSLTVDLTARPAIMGNREAGSVKKKKSK